MKKRTEDLLIMRETENFHYQVQIWIGDSYTTLENTFPDLSNAKAFSSWIKSQKGFKKIKTKIIYEQEIRRRYF